MANRPSGYNQSIAKRLELLIHSCAGIVDTIQIEESSKQVISNLRISKEMFRHTFDQSPVGTVMVNPQFQFVRCNQAFFDFLGFTANELIGRTFLEVTNLEFMIKVLIRSELCWPVI